ncbi:MAG: hypothetical protein ACK40G_14715 [Cytophagaceae bacterium]
MALANKIDEINRLIIAFENESAKFYDLDFHTFFITQKGPQINRKFRDPNHAIMLWQHNGNLEKENTMEAFINNVSNSNLKWGIRGAELTQMGLIEGSKTKQFIRMAKRAGALFSIEEVLEFKFRVIEEIQSEGLKNNPDCKPVSIINDNPLAIWLNYLLFYLSETYPNRLYSNKIEPDPFSLSLLALEHLSRELRIVKSDRSISDVSKINFRVAVSFPGEKRKFVSKVVDVLRSNLGSDSVFYDFDYQAQLARPNADIIIQKIYQNQSDLIVIFLSKDYIKKQWL